MLDNYYNITQHHEQVKFICGVCVNNSRMELAATFQLKMLNSILQMIHAIFGSHYIKTNELFDLYETVYVEASISNLVNQVTATCVTGLMVYELGSS